MHGNTRAQPIGSFSNHSIDPYFLFPDGSVHRDPSDYLDKSSELFRTAMYQLSGVKRHKLIKFLGDTPYMNLFETRCRTGGVSR